MDIFSAPISIKYLIDLTKVLFSLIDSGFKSGSCSIFFRLCANKSTLIKEIYHGESYSQLSHADSLHLY